MYLVQNRRFQIAACPDTDIGTPMRQKGLRSTRVIRGQRLNDYVFRGPLRQRVRRAGQKVLHVRPHIDQPVRQLKHHFGMGARNGVAPHQFSGRAGGWFCSSSTLWRGQNRPRFMRAHHGRSAGQAAAQGGVRPVAETVVGKFGHAQSCCGGAAQPIELPGRVKQAAPGARVDGARETSQSGTRSPDGGPDVPKPFLILQLRPETEAADSEFAAILRKGGLKEGQTRRIRLDQQALPHDLRLDDYSGVIVGGGPGCVSDAPEDKTDAEARIEAEVLSIMPEITERDFPFLGCCYGIGILGAHLEGDVSKRAWSEPVGTSACEVTADGRDDPLLQGVPTAFDAFVGHKEALQALPEGCVHLVRSDACLFQMFRYGQNVYATQFHPEADADGFETRIRIYRNKGYFPPETADDLIAMCRAADVFAPEMVLRNFVARFG